MSKTILLIIILGVFGTEASGQSKKNRIIIETDTSIISFAESAQPGQTPSLRTFFSGDSARSSSVFLPGTLTEGKWKWVIKSNDPVVFRDLVTNLYYIAQPGDSILITKSNGKVKFNGVGALRCQATLKIDEAKRKVQKPNGYIVDVESVENYLEADRYYDNLQKVIEPLLNSFANKFSREEYTFIKCRAIEGIESGRLMAFINLGHLFARQIAESRDISKLDELKRTWSQSHFKPWSKWLREQKDYNSYSAPAYFYQFIRAEVWLRFGFNMKDDSLGSKPIRTLLYYENAKTNYKGVLRERVLTYLIEEQVIQEMGPDHLMTKQILNDYYKLPGFVNYKSWISSLEKREAFSVPDWAPPFTLSYITGETFTFDDIKNKIAILDFWFTGCKGCIEMAPAIKPVKEYFKNDTNIVFIEISIDTDKEKWLNSIVQKKYTSGQGIQLYTSGQGAAHPMIKNYNISSYPTLVLIDSYGKLVTAYPPPDARGDSGKSLIQLINYQLARAKDGPYVLYDADETKSYTINTGTVREEKIVAQSTLTIPSANDVDGNPLTVELQKELKNPPSEYPKPDKLLILSDIEGNFKAFKKLLLAGDVIDENYNWSFGNGHLVFAGDMFDRGDQVTECLWLIYSLEQKAISAGGYVHFILGNHEIMNLQGDHNYAVDKYLNNAKLLGKQIADLYNTNSELGRWLRTKNIMEKIGDLLILHAGSSSGINNLPYDIEEINTIARQYYDKTSESFSTIYIKEIMGTDGPFWYRGFYKRGTNGNNQTASIKQIDSTLQKFGTSRIITGHTIVADTISVHYAGKVINTDTHHAAGKSEALLIEDKIYYRLTPLGQRILLPILPGTEKKRMMSFKNQEKIEKSDQVSKANK